MAGVCWASSRPGTSPLSRRAAWPRSSTSGTGWRSGPGKQGSRMSAADDELEHVIVVPGGLLAPAAQAGPAAAILADEVEGDLAQEGEVARGGAVPHPAVVLAEGDVNGLIANDKFCLTRPGRLRLSGPRARGRPRVSAALQLRGEVTHRGGEDATATHLADPAHGRADGSRPAALGPGLPAPPGVGDDLAGAGVAAGAPDPARGVPCA